MNRSVRRLTQHSNPLVALALMLLTFVSLLPYCTKAFHIDDPLFLWSAQSFLSGKSKPLATIKNWRGFEQTLAQINKNPPGVSVFMMPVIAMAGVSEIALHIEFALLAAVTIAGVFTLSRQLCDRPALAAIIVLASPGFFVSATTLMSDVLMLCLWTWCIVEWIRAMRTERAWVYLISGVLMAAATLAKYPGIFLVPLLAVAGLRRKHLRWQVPALLIPLIALLALQWTTRREYGIGLFSEAVGYATEQSRIAILPSQLLTGLSFLGGCFPLPAVIWAMESRESRSRRFLVACVVLIILILLFGEQLIPLNPLCEPNRTLITGHVVVFAPLGLGCLWMAGAHLLLRRDRMSLLLALWVLGIFAFAAIVNWTTNARSLLPAAPALAILALRAKWEGEAPSEPISPTALPARTELRPRLGILGVLVGLSAALSLLLALADQQFAAGSREAANRVSQIDHAGHSTWFTGHWGFQWYMETHGAVAVDNEKSTLLAGDLFVVPNPNTNVTPMPQQAVREIARIDEPVMSWISTINIPGGALFYSSVAGPLPYAVGPTPAPRFVVYRVTQNILPPKPLP